MKYGFDNDRFYIEIDSVKRPYGNMREETDYRMREIADTSNKLMISLSGGLDSQSMLHSCKEQGIPVECAFMYLPGYNDNEYNYMEIVAKKYGVKPLIIDIDPIKIKDELLEEANREEIYVYSCLWKRFLELLPDDADLVQMTHDPYIHHVGEVDSNDMRYMMGRHFPEIHRDRAMKLVKRSGKYIHACDTSEFLLSILDDDIFKTGVDAYMFYALNGASKPGTDLLKFDRWDYYIKPFFYGKYWKDELIYFPKFVGYENVDFLLNGPKINIFSQSIMVDFYKFIEMLKVPNQTYRFHEVPLRKLL